MISPVDFTHKQDELKHEKDIPFHVIKEEEMPNNIDLINIDDTTTTTSDKKRSSSSSMPQPQQPSKLKKSKSLLEHSVKSSQDPTKIQIKPFDYVNAIEDKSKVKENGESSISRRTLSSYTKQQVVVGKKSMKTSRIFSKSALGNRSLSFKN